MPDSSVTPRQALIRKLDKPGDLGWVVMAHGETYASEFGWDRSFEALVAQIAATYASGRDPRYEAAWIAELHGRRVGCIFLLDAHDAREAVAQLRILLVTAEARGHRLGRRLVATAVDFARAAGYAKVRLWTNHPLVAARRIYLERGFVLVGEEAHQSFGADLIGQTYELDLREARDPSHSPGGATMPLGSATVHRGPPSSHTGD